HLARAPSTPARRRGKDRCAAASDIDGRRPAPAQAGACGAPTGQTIRKAVEIVRMRRRLLLPVLTLLGASVVILPAVAGSETSPTITAENIGGYYGEEHRWSPAQATVAPGGAVTLRNPTEVKHGVRWV